jgi:hypothetical protein
MQPTIPISAVRLFCSSCHAETFATCNCNKPYVPATQRAAEAIAAAPGKSNRAIAAEAGVDEKTVRKARADSGADSPQVSRAGRDGKHYPATKPKASLGDRRSTVLWSTLHSIAREYLDTDPAKIVRGMDDDMRGDVRELVPRIVEWLLNAAKAEIDQ